MPDSSTGPLVNLNQPQLGQGVRNIPLPPDPFEKAERLPPPPPPPTKPTPVPPSINPPASNPPKVEAVVKPPDTPTPTPATIPTPPKLPPIPPIKSYSYKPKSSGSKVVVVLILILILLTLIGGGIYFYLKKLNPPIATDQDQPVLNLPSDQSPTSSFTKTTESPKTVIAEDKGFGVLPPVDLSAFLLKNLKLKGTVVADEAPAFNSIKKIYVYLKKTGPNIATTSAIFSADYKMASSSAENLSDSEFLARTDPQQKSYYPVKDLGPALSDLVSADLFYGLVDKKIDWDKYSLKSWEISNFAFPYFYSGNPGEKFFLPIYVFEGKAKVKSLIDGKVSEINLKLFTPALTD